MGSISNPKTWVPYMTTKDCSQGFCSLYCPQWCYIISPPPPPFEFPDDSSGPNFSPLVIAIIGILSSAFLLVSYYAIVSKYCRNRDSSRRREDHYPTAEMEENHEPSNHESWHVSSNGLDEALIKSITVFKYKKGDGLIEGADCSVCLSEFQEDESLRLLPMCCHAFHAMCIDTWLRSHSNCPLCRANIVSFNSLPSQLPPVIETPPNIEHSSQSHPMNDSAAAEEDIEMGVMEEDSNINIPKTPTRQPSDFENSDPSSSISTNIRDVEGEQIRRSISMDSLCAGRLSVASILRINHDEDDQMEEYRFPYDVGTSKEAAAEMSRSNNGNRILLCVTSPAAIKRSFSSGRFLFSKHARGRSVIIPL